MRIYLDTNTRGRYVINYLVATDMEILNSGTEKGFVIRGGRQIINISLEQWTLLISGKCQIRTLCQIQFGMQVDRVVICKVRKFKNTNWGRYKSNDYESQIQK